MEAHPAGDPSPPSSKLDGQGGLGSFHWTEVSGRPLLGWTEYDGIALWWFVHDDFATLRTRAGPKGGPGPRFPRGGGRLLEGFRLAYQIFAFAVGRILSIPVARKRDDRTRILILSQNNQWRGIQRPSEGRVRPGDAFFDSTIEELLRRGRYEVVTAFPLTGPPETWHNPLPSLRTALRRRRETGVPHQVIDAAWSLDVWRASRAAHTHFRSLWPGRPGLGALHDQLPSDRDVHGAIEDRLNYYFHTVFGRVVGLLRMAHHFLRALRPDLVVLINEEGRFERGIVVAARLLDIPVLAIQHGVIHPSHPGYIHSSRDISDAGSVRAPFCPIPNQTAVFGPYHKELLTKISAYPIESVVVTGQPRYDVLARTDTWRDRAEVLRGLHLDPAKRTVLWATQTHGLPAGENLRNVEAVYEALAGIEDTQLVLKLHPNEDQRATLYRQYKSSSSTIVGREGDTLALLHACDVLITRNSTVAMEAVALDRPVLILNLSGEPDLVEYVREGVAVGVYRRQDLQGALIRLLEEDSSLAKHRERFIERYLYRMDGKATERVVGLIDRMLKGKRLRT